MRGGFSEDFNTVLIDDFSFAAPETHRAVIPATTTNYVPTSSFYQVFFNFNGNWNPFEPVTYFIDNLRFVDANPAVAADLDLDMDVDADDWTIFMTNHPSDLSGLTAAEAFLLGDLDADLDNDFDDFVIFETVYDTVNGAGAFGRMLSGVPEPSSFALLVLGTGIALFRSRRRLETIPVLLFAAVISCSFVATDADAQLLHSWEGDLENWSVVGFTNVPVSINSSTIGVTDGSESLGITHDEDTFSWSASVTYGAGDQQYDTFANAFDIGLEHFVFEMDVTYDTASIPQGAPPTFLNVSVALNSNAGWTQVGGLATTGGTTDETLSISEPLDQWSFSDGDSAGFYQINIGMNGDWGISPATVFFDNLRVTQVSEPARLTLEIDPGNGSTSIVNESGEDRSFDYYEIASVPGSLDPVGWLSLDEQDIDAVDGTDPGSVAGDSVLEGWDAGGGSDASILTEAFLLGSTMVANQAFLNLGNAFDTNVGDQNDLTFRYRDPAKPDRLQTGIVEFLAPSLQADFNGDGSVDGDDFLIWQSAFQTGPEGDANGDGVTDGDDFLIWQVEFGSGQGAGANAIPEPASLFLVIVFLVGAFVGIRRQEYKSRQR